MAGAIDIGLGGGGWLGAATWLGGSGNISVVTPGRFVWLWAVPFHSADKPIPNLSDVIGQIPPTTPLRAYFGSGGYRPAEIGDVPW